MHSFSILSSDTPVGLLTTIWLSQLHKIHGLRELLFRSQKVALIPGIIQVDCWLKLLFPFFSKRVKLIGIERRRYTILTIT